MKNRTHPFRTNAKASRRLLFQPLESRAMFDGAGTEATIVVEPIRIFTFTIIIQTQDARTSSVAMSQTGRQAVFLPASRAEGEFSGNETQRAPATPTSGLITPGLVKSDGLSAINALFSSVAGTSLGINNDSSRIPASLKGTESARLGLPLGPAPKEKLHAIDQVFGQLPEPASFGEQEVTIATSFMGDDRGLVGMLTIDAPLEDRQNAEVDEFSDELYGTIAAETIRLFPSQANQTSNTSVDTGATKKSLTPVRAHQTSSDSTANDVMVFRKVNSIVNLGLPQGMLPLDMKPSEFDHGQPVLKASLDPIALVQMFLRAGESPAPLGAAFDVSTEESSRDTMEKSWQTWLRDPRVASFASITLGILAMATARKSQHQRQRAPFLANEVGNQRNCR